MPALQKSRVSNRRCRSEGFILVGIGLGLLAAGGAAHAADLPLKAPVANAVYNWTGFYVGGHVGFSGGSSNDAGPV